MSQAPGAKVPFNNPTSQAERAATLREMHSVVSPEAGGKPPHRAHQHWRADLRISPASKWALVPAATATGGATRLLCGRYAGDGRAARSRSGCTVVICRSCRVGVSSSRRRGRPFHCGRQLGGLVAANICASAPRCCCGDGPSFFDWR
jgi:hypothetical protein